MMWTSLNDGNYFTGEFKQKGKSGKSMWLSGTFNPILDSRLEPRKVMMFAQFNTKEKEVRSDLTQSLNALKNTIPMMELNEEGCFKKANDLFLQELGYSRLELRGKSLGFFLGNPASKTGVDKLWKRLLANEFTEEQLLFVTKEGLQKTYRTTFSQIKNLDDAVTKLIVVLASELSVMSVNPN